MTEEETAHEAEKQAIHAEHVAFTTLSNYALSLHDERLNALLKDYLDAEGVTLRLQRARLQRQMDSLRSDHG